MSDEIKEGEEATKFVAKEILKIADKKINEEKNTTTVTVVKDGVEEKKQMPKPTPEEVAQFKLEFETAVKGFDDLKWEITEKGDFAANDVAIFLRDFMARFGFWTKTGWMGMIKMDEELKKAMLVVDDNTALQFNYQALEFLAYMLTNPGGIGVEIAYEFEKIADKYSKLALVVGTQVENARKELKRIQYLQEKWGAASQGFYLADLEPELSKEEAPGKDPLQEEIPKIEGNTIEIDATKKE